MFRRHKYDPFEELIRQAKSSKTPINTKVKINSDFASIMLPKEKPQDTAKDRKTDVTVIVRRFGEETEEKQAFSDNGEEEDE